MGVVLSVDDDDFVLELLWDIFDKEDIELMQASNAIDAIEIACSEQVDVAILDVSMPHFNGLELQQILYQINPNTKIVFLSSENDNQARNDAIKSGAVAFYSKPFDRKDLVQTVKKCRNDMTLLRRRNKVS